MNAIPNNLPVQLSSFIGREVEIAEVKRLLAASRLVTLTGVGGCGKTRLAMQVVLDPMGFGNPTGLEFTDAVWFVDFAPLSDPSLVPQRLAATLDVREQPGQPLVLTLKTCLRDKHTLLLLDNCEHLIEACAQLTETLLQSCANLRILATSREALRITGEMTFLVPSLAVPEASQLFALETLTQFEALQLFTERASAVQSTFTLTHENMAAVAQICHQLDGIPLAIELAAARVRGLSVRQIAARLDNIFPLLTGGSRTALARQQTLRGAIDWDYELLSVPERVLLGRLSVFAGGWTLEAAEAVCAGESIEQGHVPDLLSRLADKSLVLVEPRQGESRYRLLETIRQYAEEKLRESREQEIIRDRQLDFFGGLAEEAEPQLRGPRQLEWLQRLETDNDNVRAALEWSLAEGSQASGTRTDAGFRLAGSLYGFWYIQNYWREGRTWFERVLARIRAGIPSSAASKAKALVGMGWLGAMTQTSPERSFAAADESLALFREVGDASGIGMALYTMALAANQREDYSGARRLAEQSVALVRKAHDHLNLNWALIVLAKIAGRQADYAAVAEVGRESLALGRASQDKLATSWILLEMGGVAEYQGDYPEAVRLFTEGLEQARALNNIQGIGGSLAKLGEVALHRWENAKAVQFCDESLSYFRQLGAEHICWPLDLLGIAACRQSDYARAVACFRETLSLNRAQGYRQGMAENLVGLATVAMGQGEVERALKLLGAVEASQESASGSLGPVDLEEYERIVSTLSVQTDRATFVRHWAAGRALSLDEAIAESDRITVSEQSETTALSRRATYPAGLTAREVEVLRWLVKGISDKEIADQLVISVRTVHGHLRAIYSKLDVTSRAAAIHVAQEYKFS